MFFKSITVLCFIGFFSRCDGLFTVVGLRTAVFQGTYKLYITRSDEMETDYKLQIQLKGTGKSLYKIIEETIELKSNDDVYERTVKFDLSRFKEVEDLNLTVHLEGSELTHVLKIFMVDSKYMTLIETDKPTYKPGDEVKFRVLVLDSETKPYQGKQVEVKITDSNGNAVSEESESLLTDKDEGWVNWVYQGRLDISDSPPLGSWNINVKVEYSSFTTKSFEVSEKNPPRFQARIKCKSSILISQDILEVEVLGEYTFKGFVEGNATVSVEVLDNQNLNSNVITKVKQGKVSTNRKFEFSLKNDLKIGKSSRVRVNLTIEENNTGAKESDSKIVDIFERDIHKIELINDERVFSPGFDFTMRAIVRRFDGEYETAKNESVKFAIEMMSIAKNITMEAKLDNSEALLIFPVPKSVKKISVTATYKGAKTSKTIFCKNWLDFLKVSDLSERKNVGDIIKIKVESTRSLKSIFALILGNLQTEHREISYEYEGFDFEFEVELTKDMTPDLNIIAYYLHERGEVIYHRLTVNVENSATSDEFKPPSHILSPGDEFIMEIRTKPNAVIGLSGVDLSVLIGHENNSIDDANVEAEKVKFKPFYEPLKINGKKSKFEEFGESNAFLITNANGDLEKTDSRSVDYDYGDGDDLFINPGNRKRKEFPESWLFECFKADRNGNALKMITAPDTITSWIFSGFSLHPEHGLSLFKQIRVNVTLNFFIKLNLPYSIRRGEILKVNVLIFNRIVRQTNTSVEVELFGNPSFEIIQRTSTGTSQCSSKATVGKNESTNIVSAPESISHAFFYIRPLETGKLKINIKATCQDDDVFDEIEKELLVEHDGITFHRNKPVWIDLTKEKFKMINFPVTMSKSSIPKSIKISATLIGDFLGPTVLDVSKLIEIPTGCSEQRLVTFVPTILATRYLMSMNKLSKVQKEKANKVLKTGYSQILERKNRDGSFNLWGYKESDSIWLTAYVVKCLIFAEGLLTVNPRHIYDGLDYLKSKQNSLGSFTENGPISHRRVQGGITSDVSLTAYILISFLENPRYANNYRNIIDKAVEYVHSRVIKLNNSYACAISAYALVLANHSTAVQILDELNSTAHVNEDQMFWTKSGVHVNESDIAHEVELSAYALLAFLKHGDTLTAIKIMNWLMTKRNAQGGFYSTQDTVIGIQAVAEMAKLFYHPNVNMNVTVAYNDQTRFFHVNSANRLKLQRIEFPSSARNFQISAKGSGKALFNLVWSFNNVQTYKFDEFNVSLNVRRSKKKNVFYLETCLKFIALEKNFSGMTVAEIALPSGYIYDSESTEFLKMWNVRKVETRNQKSIVFLYFDQITTSQICPEIKAVQIQMVEQLKSSSVKVYEYSNSANHVVEYYTPSNSQPCI